MRKLSLIIAILLAFVFVSGKILTTTKPPTFKSDSPHGEDFKVPCDQCHSSAKGWKFDQAVYSFDHGKTKFSLEGQHKNADCKQCHTSLIFKDAPTNCLGCHTDIHEQTVGPECGRCHTPNSWIINNITDLHRRTRFPLVGMHATTLCENCHKSNSMLRFEPLGVECYDCHSADFAATTSPNHTQAGYSTNCTECHNMNAFSWGGNINHSFFPLNGGHAIACQKCHTSGVYEKIPKECNACHQNDYNTATNPNHSQLGFPTNCEMCHTINGWSPADFTNHDTYFPIYSGKHNKGVWNSCSDCHKNSSNYKEFTCIDCHEHNQNDMNKEHREVGGYVYNSQACLSCHPRGSADDGFDHSKSGFPLTGAHTTTQCEQCHTNGYTTAPSKVCSACHSNKYNATTNPNHTTANIPNTCETCHTTNPGWKPATFPIHSNYYVLAGAHVSLECAKCHTNGYTNQLPVLCSGCHMPKYNATTNPNHASAQFPTECEQCHSQTAWSPATWDHNQYFPIYSGKHNKPVWNNCADCHTNPSNYGQFSCIDCHPHNNKTETDSKHSGVGGYMYTSAACLACHPTGEGEGGFNHATSAFPLTGAHATTPCASCHTNGYQNTSSVCSDCHITAYNQSVNPNHPTLSIPTSCANCHTTNPGWQPATFSIHNNYYVLAGAHVSLSCATCHNGNYNNQLPQDCYGCHTNDYNQTNNPNHQAAQFPTDCQQCHSQNAWVPANWNHDGQYFPIYTGKHKNEWNACSDCHTNASNYSIFTCTTACHPQAQTNNDHQGVAGYSYNSNACYSCHPTGNGGKLFRIDNSNFKKE